MREKLAGNSGWRVGKPMSFACPIISCQNSLATTCSGHCSPITSLTRITCSLSLLDWTQDTVLAQLFEEKAGIRLR